MKYIKLIVIFGFLGVINLFAENQIVSNMELFNTIYQGEDSWHYIGSGKAVLSFRSARDPNVQGQTELEFYPLDLYNDPAGSVPALLVKKAYVKTRFPGFRMTLGKTRVVWGQGSVFNAGDILFGSLNPVLDLSQTELRSETAWLTSVNVPLGNFSFIEGVVLPPALDYASARVSDIDQTSFGGRGYFLAGNIKIEGGYLYKGETKVIGDAVGHRPYFSLQGNLGPDWYLSSSLAIPTDAQKEDQNKSEDWKKSWIISLGLFHMQEIDRNNTLNLRLETLWLPYQNWDNRNTRDTIYGVYLYPELTWLRESSSFYSIQSVISPLDASAMITGGAGWNIYQGFTLITYLTLLVGDDTATFSWNRGDQWDPQKDQINGISFMTGVRYRF